MKNRIGLLIKKVILSVASFSFSMISFSQSCPISAGEYKLNTQNAAEANIVKRTESGGVTYNRLWCPYKAAGQPDISFYVNWVTNVPNNKFTYTWTCMPIVSSKDLINAGNKQAYATFGGYQVNDDYRRGLMKPLAEKILQEVYPFAAPCPLNSINNSNNNNNSNSNNNNNSNNSNNSNSNNSNNNNNNQDNTDFCRKKMEQLRQEQAKNSDITYQLNYLETALFNEADSRDTLSYYNKLVAALKTPNYAGIMYKEVNRFQQDQEYRAQRAIAYGISPDASAIKIAATIRDMTAARIDYLKNEFTYTQRYKKQLIAIDTEIESLKREMTQRQCSGDYGFKSCDLTGKWVFSEWYRLDRLYKDEWVFTPATQGIYTAWNNETNKSGVAVINAYDVRFKFTTSSNNIITHKYKLNNTCNDGKGQDDFHGVSSDLTMERKHTADNSFIQDKLYNISFNGKNYQGQYQREKDKGVPIDMFFFKILYTTGYQVEQNGEKLWGRFVRNPATDHTNQTTVQWWFSNWVLQNGKWVKKDEKITSPPKIR